MIYFVRMGNVAKTPDFSLPFVFSRKPGETDVYLYTGNTLSEEKSAENLLSDDILYWVTGGFRFFETEKVHAFAVKEKYMVGNNEIVGFSIPAVEITAYLEKENVLDTSKDTYESGVADAVREMHEGTFLKTALSKVKHYKLRERFDWVDWFNAACEKFPNAYVFFAHLPSVGTWAGATPELLVASDSEYTHSVSLAGTLYPGSYNEWTTKEEEEQRLVTEYIAEIFSRSGYDSLDISLPKTIKIGHLRHLQTSFKAKNMPGLLPKLIANLHPTPAVGGMPRKEGIEFILKTEKHDRLWYSGFVGEISRNATALYVNLRSMCVQPNSALLFAGAGITQNSVPEREWDETEKKLGMNIDIFNALSQPK